MRYIPQQNRSAEFDEYILEQNPVSWGQLDSTIKLLLHQHLLKEQQYLCIYCEQNIPPKTQKDTLNADPPERHPSHIEHIRPKEPGQYPHLTFEYRNLAVSCNGFEIKPDPPRTSPDFCGHPKSNAFDDTLFLHPFEEPNIESFFVFDVNGKIKSSGKDPARSDYSINILGLNHEKLQSMRERYYNLILDEIANGGLDIADFLDASQVVLPKFYSMLKQFFVPVD